MMQLDLEKFKVRTSDNKTFPVSELSKFKPGQFVEIIGYRKENGEVANYVINGNISYDLVVQRSAEILENFDVFAASIPDYLSDFTTQELHEIKCELIGSYTNTLNKTPEQISEETDYVTIAPGVQYKDGFIYIFGLIVPGAKVVTQLPTDDRSRKRKSKTLAKEWFRYMVPVSKFRRFTLCGNFLTIKYGKKKLGSK